MMPASTDSTSTDEALNVGLKGPISDNRGQLSGAYSAFRAIKSPIPNVFESAQGDFDYGFRLVAGQATFSNFK
jgi:hypothetical protein